ncbi:arsenic resistance N-acetyltransferase ArsN2 [Spirosoma endbachense]|uniref:GNAT family N-acetyltransferase n=1 Tax=Spirosoma endbachense TaxID=2666025 RepID=A0A6P1VNE8_9BACT|nr:arsenic resistance N-acetyltransferase ArsN2 [Spirosoma endbachense]QHV94613.1 GNAT family N-acetyltransferase [Spirosoma endbachense]
MSFHIEYARPEDKDIVIALLHQGHLLTDDLPADLADFVIAKDARKSIGVAGLERFNEVGLLRSVAVDPAFQGKQIGAQLVGRILETARAVGLREVYLITTTADRYFERYGFQVVNRQDVPVAIQQTQQFSDLCPSSAIVMKRVLTPDQA